MDFHCLDSSDLGNEGFPLRPQYILRLSKRLSRCRSFFICVGCFFVWVGIKERPLCNNSAKPVPMFISASLRTKSFMSVVLIVVLMLRNFALRWCRRLLVSFFGSAENILYYDAGQTWAFPGRSPRLDRRNFVGPYGRESK